MTKSKSFRLDNIHRLNTVYLFLTAILLLCMKTSIAHAAVVLPAAAKQHRNQLAELTVELTQLMNQYRKASADDKTVLETSLHNVAEQRRSLLASMAQDEPEAVLNYALPKQVRATFPEQVQPLLEQWINAQGTLLNVFEDNDDPENSRLHFYLQQDKTRIALSVAGDNQKPKYTSGSAVTVQGLLFGQTADQDAPLLVLNSEQLMLAAGAASDPTITSSPTILDNTLGEQRTAVFLINFQDNPADQPWTTAQISDRFFTDVSQFFYENSYQQTWLTGNVFGWYTLPVNSTDSCDQWGMADAADAIATANNVDLNQYDRYVYVFPKNTCSWSGFAMVGGTKTRAWVNGVPFTKVPAHEMGHNFGLLHAHGLNCEGDATDTNCVSITYGDQLDTMGSKPGHYNAFEKERLGWLNQSQTPPLVTVTQSGSYAIEEYETATNNAKALKIYRDVDPATGTNRWYYLEFRQPVGEDQFITTDPYLVDTNITNGVVVRLGSENDGNTSYLLDMTPESTTLSSNFADLYDPALVSGASYTDSATGMTITTEYTDSQTATVYVNYSGGDAPQTCSHANPQVTVSPTESQWVAAGTSVNFTVNVSNQDNSSCSSATFDISANLPSGWNANTAQLTLAPGEIGSAVIAVTSSTSAADGFYTIGLMAQSVDNSNYSNSAAVTYVVSNPTGNSAPTAVNDSAVMTQIAPIVINVLSNDFDPDNDPIYIAGVGAASKGDVSVNADGTLVYSPAKRFKGSDSFTYTISDGMASATATVSISLQNSGGSTGGTTKGKGGGRTK